MRGVTDAGSAHATMAAISKWLETLESCRLPLMETPEASGNLMRAKTKGRSEHNMLISSYGSALAENPRIVAVALAWRSIELVR